jgi:hypothetical protein
MAVKQVSIPAWDCTCDVCGHRWQTTSEILPVRCASPAKCRHWNSEKTGPAVPAPPAPAVAIAGTEVPELLRIAKEIKRRRRKNHDVTNWNPDKICMKEQTALIDWIETELGAIPSAAAIVDEMKRQRQADRKSAEVDCIPPSGRAYRMSEVLNQVEWRLDTLIGTAVPTHKHRRSRAGRRKKAGPRGRPRSCLSTSSQDCRESNGFTRLDNVSNQLGAARTRISEDSETSCITLLRFPAQPWLFWRPALSAEC